MLTSAIDSLMAPKTSPKRLPSNKIQLCHKQNEYTASCMRALAWGCKSLTMKNCNRRLQSKLLKCFFHFNLWFVEAKTKIRPMFRRNFDPPCLSILAPKLLHQNFERRDWVLHSTVTRHFLRLLSFYPAFDFRLFLQQSQKSYQVSVHKIRGKRLAGVCQF